MRKIIMMTAAAVLLAAPAFAYPYNFITTETNAGSLASSATALHGFGNGSEISSAFNQGSSTTTAVSVPYGVSTGTVSEDNGGVGAAGVGMATAGESGYAGSSITTYNSYNGYYGYPY